MKGRVLIIDDEAEIRRNLTFGLSQEGYTPVSCPDGISAIHELDQARKEGIAYNYLVTDIFMPDIDGLKILKVIKNQYPQLPVLVITGFGDVGLEFEALSEHNTGYLDKPFEIPDLVKALEELNPGTTLDDEATPAAQEAVGIRESVSAYFTIRVDDPERSLDIYKELYELKGVRSCEAVRGDVDIIVLAQTSSQQEIQQLGETIAAIAGVNIVSQSGVEQPKLDRDVDEFIKIYSRVVKQPGKVSPGKQPGTTSYIIVDIEPEAIQQIFTTVFFINEVVFCDVIDEGKRLVGMITGQGAVGRTPRIIEKLNEIDGVLRVREAKIIKLIED